MDNMSERNELEKIWSVVSHDLASPLFTLQSNLDHLDGQLLPQLIGVYQMAKEAGLDVPFIRRDQLAYDQEILGNTRSLIENVRQQMARWDRKFLMHRFERKNQNVDIVSCVKKAITDYKTTYCLNDKSRIHVDLIESTILGDEETIQYILFELLENAEYALEATGDENPMVFISSTMDEKYYRLSIKNRIVPIEASLQEKLFDPYFSTRSSHIGLGLTYCKQAMQKIGGEIICKTQEENKVIEFILSFLK